MENLIKHLDSLEVIEQKTEAWLNARKLLISASEAGYLLGIKGIQVILDYILSKVDSKSMGHISKLEPTLHGTIYEDISRTIYCLRNKLVVKEYGLIKTEKNPILGASPDGIVIDILLGGNKDRIGNLVEIKNPFTFDDTDKIKDEYKIQILQQQYVLGIEKCDFIKTNIISSFGNSKTNLQMGIKPYKNLSEMLNDTYIIDSGKAINNKNIPIKNLTSNGNEKVLL